MEFAVCVIISTGLVLNIITFALTCTMAGIDNRVLRNILIVTCLATFWGYIESLLINAFISIPITLSSILSFLFCNLVIFIMVDLLLLDFGIEDFKVSEIIGLICVFIISSTCWTVYLI